MLASDDANWDGGAEKKCEMIRRGGTCRRLGKQGLIEVTRVEPATSWPLAGTSIRCYPGKTDSAKCAGL
jgi:hypothetical protein